MSSGKPRPRRRSRLQPADPELRSKLAAALALLSKPTTPAKRGRAISGVLGAAGFTKLPDIIPLPDELTNDQRAVVQALSELSVSIYGGWAVPNTTRKLRRWIDPSLHGVLERPITFHHRGTERTEPLWRAMMRASSKRDQILRDQDLLIAERLEVLGDIYLGAYNIDRHKLRWGSLDEIGTAAGQWARRTANGLCLKRHGTTGLDIKWPVFLGLLRAGIPIEERWDWLLPVDEGKANLALGRTCAEAIPEHRRDAAIAGAVRALSFPSSVVNAGLAMLAHFPSRHLADLILGLADRADGGPRNTRVAKKDLLAAMDRIGARSHAVATAVATFRGEAPPVPLLLCSSVLAITSPGALDPIHRRQLAAAGETYDGRSAATPLEFVELYTITDADGAPKYDAWLYMADSGAIYVTGTVTEVACIIQGGLECDDPGLREGLRNALRDRPRV